MNYKPSICGFLLLASAGVSAQVASHAPTVFTQPSASEPATAALMAVGKPVARVNGSVLTDADLVREEYTIFPYARQHNGLPKDLAPQIRNGALKMIIFEELVYQEALKRKMTVPGTKMQRAEIDFRKQFNTADEFNAFLRGESHGSQQILQAKIRRSLLIDSFLKVEVENKSTVSPTELRYFYDKNPARFEHPESFTFQSISFLPPTSSTAEKVKDGRSRAEHALGDAKATKSTDQFGLLAEKISDDDFRVMMGQHKPMPADQLPPQIVKALTAMKVGEVSDVIQVEQAYAIVRLQEHTPAGKTKFDDVKVQLEKELQQNKTNQTRAALDKKLRQNAKIEEM